ncbi:MAG: M23 family metallopeptidase, partial [Proteobacteria bacterium]
PTVTQEIDEESFSANVGDTFARGGEFPFKFLSSPTCGSPRGVVRTSNYGPRPRPVTAWGWRKNKRGKSVKVPIRWGSAFHKGLDFGGRGAGLGTPIIATADGIINNPGLARGGYGNQVFIDHGNGFKTQYAHLKAGSIPRNMRHGMPVKRGQIIGYMGNTGNSGGAHLHFNLWKDGSIINPTGRFLIDTGAKGQSRPVPELSRSCSNLPSFDGVDQVMDQALRGALRSGSRTSSGRATRSTYAQ